MKLISIPTLRMYIDYLDAGKSFQEQSVIQQHLHAMLYTSQVAIQEHTRLKKSWDAALMEGDLSGLSWASFEFSTLFPIATAGAFYPEFDFECRRIQALNTSIGSLSLLTFSLTQIGDRTHAIFAWLDEKRPNQQFVDSLRRVDRDVISSALVQFCFDTSDNVFVKPSWWNGLSAATKSALANLLSESTPGSKVANGLRLIGSDLFAAELLNVHFGSSKPSW